MRGCEGKTRLPPKRFQFVDNNAGSKLLVVPGHLFLPHWAWLDNPCTFQSFVFSWEGLAFKKTTKLILLFIFPFHFNFVLKHEPQYYVNFACTIHIFINL